MTPEFKAKVEAAQRIFLRNEDFPRDYLSLAANIKRRPIYSFKQYMGQIFSAIENRQDAYISVYGARQRADRMIDVVYLDIDTPPEFLESNLQLVKDFAAEAGASIYFSGRGFHVYIGLPAPIPIDDIPRVKLMDALVYDYGFQVKSKDRAYFIDPHVILDINRVSRVPYTLNTKSGRYCIPLSPLFNLEEVIYFSENPEELSITPRCNPERGLRLIERVQHREILDEHEGAAGRRGESSTIEWIERLIAHPVPDGRHRILWLVLAPYFVNIKQLGRREAYVMIKDYLTRCKAVVDTNADEQILYYIDHAKRNGMSPIGLRTMEAKYPDLYALIKQAIS